MTPFLNQTKPDELTDGSGQPYFVWDQRMTLEEFRSGLNSDQPGVRARFAARLLRDARPDDVFLFLDRDALTALWTEVEPLLGRSRDFWAWLLGEQWGWVDAVVRSDAG